MSEAAVRPHLVRTTREWAFPALALLLTGTVVVVALLFLPSFAQSLERETFQRYSASIGSSLRLWAESERLANASQERMEPLKPDSRSGRLELTRSRQTAAAALADLRRIHPPIGAEEVQATLDRALVLWIKGLNVLEGGYVAHSSNGWIRALSDVQDLRKESYNRLRAAEAALVKRGRDLGIPFKKSASALGLAATLQGYEEPAQAETELSASTDATYRSALQRALDRLQQARATYSVSRRDYARAAANAAIVGDVAAARLDVERQIEDATKRQQEAIDQAQAAAIAFETLQDPTSNSSRAAAQRNMARFADVLAFTIMPGRKAIAERILALELSADRGPDAEQRFARLVAESRRLDAAEQSVAPLFKRAQSELSFLNWSNR
jgi:hypothetical protein